MTLVRAFPNHLISLYQSAVDQLAKDQVPSVSSEAKSVHGGSEIAAPLVDAAAQIAALRMDGRVPMTGADEKSLNSTFTCAGLGLQYFEARIKNDEVAARILEGKINEAKCDPGWLSILPRYLEYFGPNGTRRSVPYRRAADVGPYIITIKSDAKIAIVGDWGTGSPPALRVARQIAQFEPDILIHLGDIYYSGTPEECKSKFLDVLDQVFDRPRTALPVFTLAGNHDMYSGGAGYYALIDGLNDGPLKQRASFFCLRTEDNAWQLLGMDTGLNDYSPLSVSDTLTFLEPDEEEWHLERIKEFPGNTILLSHHQLFSSFTRIGPKDTAGRHCPYNPRLRSSYDKFRDTGRTISAWLWGHEHILSIYEPYLDLARGRCLGHGAVPVLLDEYPYRPLRDLNQNAPLLRGQPIQPGRDVYDNGFAILTLTPPNKGANLTYYQDRLGDGVAILAESLAGDVQPLPPISAPLKPSAKTIFFVPQAAKRAGSRKVAFVIGNQDYLRVPKLSNPAGDAAAVRVELEKLGFDVYGGIDFDTTTIASRFEQFVKRCDTAEVAVFYYSGHGVQIDAQNYLVPIDCDVRSLLSASENTSIQRLVNRITGANVKCLVFLDACRDAPLVEEILASSQPGGAADSPNSDKIGAFLARGLAPIQLKGEAQVFTAFAAAPGRFAYGSGGQYSEFTQAFVDHVATQGLEIDELMHRVRVDVRRATKDSQDPWSQTNLDKSFYFKPVSSRPIIETTTMGVLSAAVAPLIGVFLFLFNPPAMGIVRGWEGLFFGLAIGLAILRWGRKSFSWSVLAVIAAALSWRAGIAFVDYIGATIGFPKEFQSKIPFFQNPELMRWVMGNCLAATIFASGTLAGAALSTPALRRFNVYAVTLLAGVAASLVQYPALYLLSLYSGRINDAVLIFSYNFLQPIIWAAFVGASIGYGLSRYVPEPWERGS